MGIGFQSNFLKSLDLGSIWIVHNWLLSPKKDTVCWNYSIWCLKQLLENLQLKSIDFFHTYLQIPKLALELNNSVIPQVAAGWLANAYGPKWFLVGAMFVCSAAGILIPAFAAQFGSKGVMAIRAIQGLSQGFIFPSVHNLLSHWVPPGERSRLGTFVYAGKLTILL